MDTIYLNSEITIIAIAGDDPSYGLPGVGVRHRTRRVYKQTANYTLFTPPQPYTYTLSGSAWAKRGWIYQEGLLSRRRLIFKDDEIMFECRGMYCLETFNLPYRSMQGNESKEPHSEPILEVQYRGNGENFMGLFALDVSRRQEHIFHRISEFTQRDLSQISDRLNAFRGILGFFEKKFGMRHLWGSSIMEQRLVHVKSSQRQLYFLLGLCWCFGPDQGGNQATNLPSWSWSGWSGHCQYINTVMNEQTFDYFTKDKNPTREEGGTISDMEVTVQVEESPEHGPFHSSSPKTTGNNISPSLCAMPSLSKCAKRL